MNKVYLLLVGTALRPGNWGCGRVGFALNKGPKREVGKEASRFCFYHKSKKTPSAAQEPVDKLVPVSFMRTDISGTVEPQRSFCSSLLTFFFFILCFGIARDCKKGFIFIRFLGITAL